MNKTRSILMISIFNLILIPFFGCTQGVNNSKTISNENKTIDLSDLSAFKEPTGYWEVKDNEIFLPFKKGWDRTNLWLKGDYKNFILEVDFKFSEGTNSGIIFRTTDTNYPVQNGIEVQIRDDYGKTPIDKHFCGSVYSIKQVSENRVKPAGDWNHVKIVCNNYIIKVYLNHGKVVDINLKNWTEKGRNPDGTPNKFNKPYNTMVENGKIGFQDHGGKVQFKNIKIKKL